MKTSGGKRPHGYQTMSYFSLGYAPARNKGGVSPAISITYATYVGDNFW